MECTTYISIYVTFIYVTYIQYIYANVHKYSTHTVKKLQSTICYLEETCLKYAKKDKYFLNGVITSSSAAIFSTNPDLFAQGFLNKSRLKLHICPLDPRGANKIKHSQGTELPALGSELATDLRDRVCASANSRPLR